MLTVRPIDAVTDRASVSGEILIVLHDVADHIRVVHLTQEIILDVLAETHMRCSRVKLRRRRVVVIRRQIAGRDEIRGRGAEDKRLKDFAEPLPANPFRRRRHAEHIGSGEMLQNSTVRIGNDMMTLIADQKIGRLHLMQTVNERLHRGDLHRQIIFLRCPCCNKTVANAHCRERRRCLLDKFLPMYHENSAPPRKCGAARHPCRHNCLARAAGRNGAHTPPPL